LFKLFAGLTSATIQASFILGKKIRSGSVWQTVEFPILKENPNVEQIMQINPETMQKSVL